MCHRYCQLLPVDLDRLETRLYDIGCDLHSVAVTLSGLRKFAAVDHIAGVPIGPEASGILGNAFLIAVDRMLMSLGAEHLRWMDDFKIMGRDTHACESIVDRFDQFLRTQGLTRSDEKTDYYSDPSSAIAALRGSPRSDPRWKQVMIPPWMNCVPPSTDRSGA